LPTDAGSVEATLDTGHLRRAGRTERPSGFRRAAGLIMSTGGHLRDCPPVDTRHDAVRLIAEPEAGNVYEAG